MPTYLQSVDAPLQLSFDNGATWKTLVCLENFESPLAKTLTETPTFCGTLQGQGNPKLDFSGEAVMDLAPNVNQVSYEDLVAVMLAGTGVIKGRVAYPGTGSVGSQLYLQSDVVVESVNGRYEAEDYVKFSVSLKGQGLPTITPP